MPEDEGDALFVAAERGRTGRARRAVPRGRQLLRAVDDLARRSGPRDRSSAVRRRPPPWVGGEPGRAGSITTASVVDATHRSDGHAALLPRRRSTTPGSRSTSSRSSGAHRWSPPTGAHPLAFLFIDGGHGVEPARADFHGWTPHVAPGGTLAIHDVFPDPADGGRPPYEEIYLPALESGFELRSTTGSLRILRRRA